MEITSNIVREAERILQYEGVSDLPKQIGSTPFYIAAPKDQSIIAHGVVEFEKVEYKIGTQKM